MAYQAPLFKSVHFTADGELNKNLDLISRTNNHDGDGLLAGVVSIEGVPTSDLIVHVWNPVTERIAREVGTNPVGAFLVENIEMGWGYDIIAFDSMKLWEKKVSSRRFPVPMIPELRGILTTWIVDEPISETLEIHGGVGPYSASVSGGSLPSGVSISVNGSTIIFSEPTSTGTGSATIKITDSLSRESETEINWEVSL